MKESFELIKLTISVQMINAFLLYSICLHIWMCPRITVDYILNKAILFSQSSNHNAICLHILPVPINNNKWVHALLRGIMWFVYNLAANKLFWHLGQCGLFHKSWLKQIILQNVHSVSSKNILHNVQRGDWANLHGLLSFSFSLGIQ